MLHLLKGYNNGSIRVNNIVFTSVNDAIKHFQDYTGRLVIEIESSGLQGGFSPSKPQEVDAGQPIYKIKVKQYMIKPATPEFDFHDKMNNGHPMPMRIMIGKKLQETPGMVKMELWGEINEEISTHCMKCGRTLTNQVSKYFGIGPECGNHGYNNPFDDEAELKRAVKEVDKQLREIKWTGWIIKSALEKFELIRQESID